MGKLCDIAVGWLSVRTCGRCRARRMNLVPWPLSHISSQKKSLRGGAGYNDQVKTGYEMLDYVTSCAML